MCVCVHMLPDSTLVHVLNTAERTRIARVAHPLPQAHALASPARPPRDHLRNTRRARSRQWHASAGRSAARARRVQGTTTLASRSPSCGARVAPRDRQPPL